MMQTTEIRYRRVNVSPETTTYGATCSGESATAPRCAAPVAWCRQTTTAAGGPFFYYYCADHAALTATADGLSLEPDAPGFADSPRPAAVPSTKLEPELRWTRDRAPDADSVLIQYPETDSDSVRSESDSDSVAETWQCPDCLVTFADSRIRCNGAAGDGHAPNPYAVGSILPHVVGIRPDQRRVLRGRA